MMPKNTAKDFFRFFNKTQGCWIWNGSIGHNGYGRFCFNYKTIRAHRFSYQIHVGNIHKNILVLHKCDNRRCVNPDHLFLGTQQDNIDDMMKKKRNNGGKRESHGMAKVSEKDVKFIRENFKRFSPKRSNTKHLAEKFNMSIKQINNIVRGKHWPSL